MERLEAALVRMKPKFPSATLATYALSAMRSEKPNGNGLWQGPRARRYTLLPPDEVYIRTQQRGVLVRAPSHDVARKPLEIALDLSKIILDYGPSLRTVLLNLARSDDGPSVALECS